MLENIHLALPGPDTTGRMRCKNYFPGPKQRSDDKF